jgi:hypothetical protein
VPVIEVHPFVDSDIEGTSLDILDPEGSWMSAFEG